MNQPLDKTFFRELYRGFAMPLCSVDCGLKCGPYNDYGVPVCCDIHLVVPSAFNLEWSYLQENTDLWRPWSSTASQDQALEDELQDGQVLLQCKGYQECQRDYRTLTCRAFPFFPYLDSQGVFCGLAYYPDFREFCWIISNLDVVSQSYKEAFQRTFKSLFELYPEYRENYAAYSAYIRQKTAKKHHRLVLLGFKGQAYWIEPLTEERHQAAYEDLDAFGPFTITRELRFPDESASQDTFES